jgi:HEAT repeat protein
MPPGPTPTAGSRARRRWIFFAAVAVAISSLAILFWPEPEPIYEDRTATEWSLDLLSPLAAVRSNATVTLQKIGPEAIPSLLRQLERRDSLLKRPFIALAPHLPVSWRRAFTGAMRPFEPSDGRLAAATALRLYGTNVPPEPLLRRLRDVERSIAAQAAVTLAAVGPPAVPGLIQALDDREAWVRAMACQALIGLGPDAAPAVGALARCLDDRELQIAHQAASALLRIGPPAVPYLESSLSHPNPNVRYHAARVLGSLGGRARGTVPALIKAAHDPDPAVQGEARRALRVIAPDLALDDPPADHSDDGP